jgi:hypothetical protein
MVLFLSSNPDIPIHLADHHHPLADKLEDMSFADGEKLNNRLMELSKGPQYATPDSKLQPYGTYLVAGLSTNSIRLERIHSSRVHYLRPLGEHACP